MSEHDSLDRVAAEVSACTKCILHKSRVKAVPGEGLAHADIMFVGEGPGFHENQQGRPFVGAAGQFLEELLASIGLKREQVFITNVVKCFISPRVMIYTTNGYKPVKDIRVGDLVLTHSGRFRQVTYVRPQEILPAGSDVVRLAISPPDGGKPVRLTVTPEHPFLVNGEWKAAREIQVADRVSTLDDRCDPVAITARASERTRQLVAAGEAEIQRMTTLERLLKNHRGEYVFVEAVVTQAEHRTTRRNFPLYNIGVEEDESYIAAGVVSHNCRPPGNRDPLPEEIEACKQYLDRQIALIKPKVIVTLGRYSMARAFPNEKISRIHGQPKKVEGIVYMPMFHPAAALHQSSLRKTIEEDFKKLPAILAEIETLQDEEPPSPQAQQLSLF